MCEFLLIVLIALPLGRVPGTPASGWGGGAWASGELLRGWAEKQPWASGGDPTRNWSSWDPGSATTVREDWGRACLVPPLQLQVPRLLPDQ